MSTEIKTSEMMIGQLLTMWTSRNKAATDFFNKYTNNDVYMMEVAPGRNRAIYLLGHLVSTNDGLLPLFGIGERLFPELEQIFSKSPDRAIDNLPSIPELKEKWEKVNATLTAQFNKMNVNDWMGRHTAVSEEEFVKEPHRNKLNLLIGRTNHQSYHLGQLNLLKA